MQTCSLQLPFFNVVPWGGVADRLAQITALVQAGIRTTVRMDPLFPGCHLHPPHKTLAFKCSWLVEHKLHPNCQIVVMLVNFVNLAHIC